MNEQTNRWMHTDMGSTTPTSITVCGMDLADDIMGKISFPDLAFRMVAGRLPDERESVLFNAVLVSLADHGITPTVLAARLTYLGAPEALQGAVAAGLLGGGSVFLGVAEDAARFLDEMLAGVAAVPDDGAALRTAASRAIAALREQGRRTPGLGHPVHKDTDPRVPRMYALAGGARSPRPASRAAPDRGRGLRRAERAPASRSTAPASPGAALADLGFDWRIIRGFALLARTAGLLGHLAEEMRDVDGDAALAGGRGRSRRLNVIA